MLQYYDEYRKIMSAMRKMTATRAVAALGALAHEHRLAAYRLLVEAGPEGLPAGGIAERLGLVPSSLTFHVQALARAGLITQRRASRHVIYAADFDAMNGLIGFLARNCCGQEALPAVPVCEPGRARASRAISSSRRRSA